MTCVPEAGAGIRVGLAAAGSQVDEREAHLGPVGLSELGWRLPDDHLERRPHPAVEQVTATRAAIGEPEHGMDVELWLVPSEREVTGQGQHLALLVDGNPAVLLAATVVPADGRAL